MATERMRVIKPAEKEDKVKKFEKQPVIDPDIKERFILLKREHGREISSEVLKDHFYSQERDFQRFLINELNGEFNDGGIDGVIGPRTARDAARINYVADPSVLAPEYGAVAKIVAEEVEVSRDADKSTDSGNNVTGRRQYGKSKKIKRFKVKKR